LRKSTFFLKVLELHIILKIQKICFINYFVVPLKYKWSALLKSTMERINTHAAEREEYILRIEIKRAIINIACCFVDQFTREGRIYYNKSGGRRHSSTIPFIQIVRASLRLQVCDTNLTHLQWPRAELRMNEVCYEVISQYLRARRPAAHFIFQSASGHSH